MEAAFSMEVEVSVLKSLDIPQMSVLVVLVTSSSNTLWCRSGIDSRNSLEMAH